MSKLYRAFMVSRVFDTCIAVDVVACDGHRQRDGAEAHADGISAWSPLSPGDLEMIRRQVEEFEVVAAVDDEIRGIAVRNWPSCYRSFRPRKIDAGA
jgi:hypothetical protein